MFQTLRLKECGIGLADKHDGNESASRKPTLCLYAEEELDEYEAYLESVVGAYPTVFHEIVPPDIRLDVVPILPSEIANYWTLVAMGAGAYRMNVLVDLAHRQLEYAECVILLPADCNFGSSDENDFWPIGNPKGAAHSHQL